MLLYTLIIVMIQMMITSNFSRGSDQRIIVWFSATSRRQNFDEREALEVAALPAAVVSIIIIVVMMILVMVMVCMMVMVWMMVMMIILMMMM